MAKLKKNLKKVGPSQVWNRTAKQTPGGLKRKDLYKDKYGIFNHGNHEKS